MKEGCELKRAKCIPAAILEVFVSVFICPDLQQGSLGYSMDIFTENISKP